MIVDRPMWDQGEALIGGESPDSPPIRALRGFVSHPVAMEAKGHDVGEQDARDRRRGQVTAVEDPELGAALGGVEDEAEEPDVGVPRGAGAADRYTLAGV